MAVSPGTSPFSSPRQGLQAQWPWQPGSSLEQQLAAYSQPSLLRQCQHKDKMDELRELVAATVTATAKEIDAYVKANQELFAANVMATSHPIAANATAISHPIAANAMAITTMAEL